LTSLIDRLRRRLAEGPRAGAPLFEGDRGRRPMADLRDAAVLVPLVDRAEPGLLLTTRAPDLSRHAGQVAFPGGRVDETDAGPVAAALREAEEEIGLAPRHVEILGLCQPYRTGSGFRIAPVVGLVPPDLALSPQPGEVADIFEVPLAHVLEAANYVERNASWEGATRSWHELQFEGRLIWGATASMLLNLGALLR
jgi:8-oxo-dGTP pyrophosphatase MutT (NUDIX family)